MQAPGSIRAGLWAALLSSVGLTHTPAAKGETEGLEVGTAAPTFTLKTMNPSLANTESITLAELVGPRAKRARRSVLLTFGASYCAPCRAEWQKLKTRHAELEAAGVSLLAVVIDKDEVGQREMARFVEKDLAATFPVLLDRFGILARRYRASSLPYSVVIDGESGTITEVHVGYEERVLDQMIGKLIAARSTPP